VHVGRVLGGRDPGFPVVDGERECSGAERIVRDLQDSRQVSSTYVCARSASSPTTRRTIRAFGQATGRLTIEELVDRYPLRCRPIRGLLVDYLRERQPSLDFASIDAISRSLTGLFWARIEAIAPGIDTLQLPQDIVRTWKDKTRPHHQADLWAAALVDFGGFCRRNFVLISLT